MSSHNKCRQSITAEFFHSNDQQELGRRREFNFRIEFQGHFKVFFLKRHRVTSHQQIPRCMLLGVMRGCQSCGRLHMEVVVSHLVVQRHPVSPLSFFPGGIQHKLVFVTLSIKAFFITCKL